MLIPPINLSADVAEVESAEHLFNWPHNAIFRWGKLQGVRSEQDQRELPVDFMSFPNAIIIVGDREIIYMTSDYKYIPQLYPKPWPYARYLVPSGQALAIKDDVRPRHRLAGNVFMPFVVAGNWFHVLFDNYARLYFLDQLPVDAQLKIGVPFWGNPPRSAIPSDRAIVHAAFLQGQKTARLEKGTYEIERLIAPPLANSNDYMLAEPVRFVADRLSSTLIPKQGTHPLRLFISRADIPVRNLINEADLAIQLRKLGFIVLCPGDYHFQSQLELFAAAEIIVGVHGQGFTPIISARHCRAVMEFEAAGWAFTAYRSIAQVLGIPYRKLPCDLIEHRNPGRFDWLARADIAACISEIERVL